jgi:hypothetical protein
MISVEIDGGPRLQFPAGTDPEVIQRVVRQVVSGAQPSPPPPGPPQTPGRMLGLGARDMLVGLPALPGMLYDAVGAGINTVTGGIEALGGPSLPRVRTAADNLERASDAVNLPRPATDGERLTAATSRSVAGAIPAFGVGAALRGAGVAPEAARLLVGNLPSQVAGAAGAGLAGETAAQAGAGPVGQIVAGLAGGVGGAGATQALEGAGRATAAMVQPFREAGRERIVSDLLLRSSANPEGLPARIAAGVDDPARRLPGSPVTTALASRDPGLMLLESGMRSQVAPNTPTGMSPAVALRDVEARRNASRLEALAGLGDNSTPDVRGGTVRAALGASDDAMGERVGMAFNIARDRNTNRYSVEPVLAEARRTTAMFAPEQGGGGVPAALQSVVDDIAAIGNLSLDQAQNLRSRLGEIAGQASASGDARLARAAGAISASLENTIADPRWVAAVAARRAQGQAVGRNAEGVGVAGQILRTDRFGMPMLPDADVANRALQSPAATRQVLEAYYKALDDARTARLPVEQIEALRGQVVAARDALRGQFIESLFRASATTGDMADAAGNVSRALSPAGFRRFFEQNQGVARELFNQGQLAQLQRLAADFAETGLATRTTNAAGSNTAQNLSVANLIARGSNGLIDPGTPLAQTFAGLGGVMRLVYSAPEAATREMLTRAMTDPTFARLLLARATPASVARAARYVEMNMVDRLTEAATEAAGRATVRTGTAEATRPERQ